VENKRLLIAMIILVVNVTVFLASSPRTSVELDFNGFESMLIYFAGKAVAWSFNICGFRCYPVSSSLYTTPLANNSFSQ